MTPGKTRSCTGDTANVSIPVCLRGDELVHGSVVEVVLASQDELRKHLFFHRPIPKIFLEGSSAAGEEEFIWCFAFVC